MWPSLLSIPLISLSFSLARARDEARSAAGFALGGEGRGGTVIIKSCNQLANLSSSVLIKPGPHRAFCFSFSLFRLSLLLVPLYFHITVSSFPLALVLPSFLSLFAALSSFCTHALLPTHAKLFLPFRTSRRRAAAPIFRARFRAFVSFGAIFRIFH